MAEPARETLTPVHTVRVCSQRLGTYEVPEDMVLNLSEGLVGLPEARRFALLEPSREGSPFRYLLCIDQPEMGFLVCDPESFWPGYSTALPLSEDGGAAVAVLAIVTVPADPREMTANLMAPLVVDCASRRGRQVVLDGERYSTRHLVLPQDATRQK